MPSQQNRPAAALLSSFFPTILQEHVLARAVQTLLCSHQLSIPGLTPPTARAHAYALRTLVFFIFFTYMSLSAMAPGRIGSLVELAAPALFITWLGYFCSSTPYLFWALPGLLGNVLDGALSARDQESVIGTGSG